MTTDDPDPLDDLLSQCQIQVETPPDFRREVWRKVAAETCKPGWVERVAWWLLRPKREALILTAVIILAIAWGLTHPPEEMSPHHAYVMSISPFDPNQLSGR